LRNFTASIFYIAVLVVIHYFHSQVRSAVVSFSGKQFALYVIYGLFLSYFLINLFRAWKSRSDVEIAAILLVIGTVSFFLVSRPFFLFKLQVLEFFILGSLLAIENKKTKGLGGFSLAFLLLVGAAALAELSGNVAAGSTFYYLDVWTTTLFGLSGYIATGLGFR
jgi:hypothetical protein